MSATTGGEGKEEPTLRIERTAEKCLLVIFGASGDLTRRKLIPALFDLECAGALPPVLTIVGVGRTPMSHEAFRVHLESSLREFGKLSPEDEARWPGFASRLHYVTTDAGNRDAAAVLRTSLLALEDEHHTGGNMLLYLATPPSLYEPIIRTLDAAGLHAPRVPGSWVRLIIEKPFGTDLDSARRLNATLLSVFTEDQVYRIDHYLGKETVQNLLVFRFANGIFEPIWNRNYIDNIQITAAETVGVENRGAYFEEAGTLRDMVENHLLQVLALTAMEPPVLFDARQVRDEKQKVFAAIRPYERAALAREIVRAQYSAGAIGGKAVPAYRAEPGVSPGSVTETYVALRVFVDNWRWADVPFYIRTGKRLPRRVTEITVQFRRTPHLLFAGLAPDLAQNMLVIRIQPDEGVSLRFATKTPGSSVRLTPVTMDFSYGDAFGGHLVEAYTRLLLDCMIGDQTLFARGDSVDTAWTILTPVLDAWSASAGEGLFLYPAGSWGPEAADELLRRDGRIWRLA